MGLTRSDFIKPRELKHETVEVPELGGTVTVRELTAAERDSFEWRFTEARESGAAPNLRGMLVARTVVDDEGNRILTDEDADAVGKQSAAWVDRLFAVAQRLSGITGKDVEELEGN